MTGSEWFAAAPGGLNRYFTELATALARQPGIDVSAAAFGATGSAPPGARSWGGTGGSTIRRARTAFLDRGDLRRDGTAATVLDRHFCLYGPAAVDRHGTLPLVVHFHGPWAAESRMSGQHAVAARAKYLIERARYRGADRFVVLSNNFRDVLHSDYRVPLDRIAVIAPGVDLNRFHSTPIRPATSTRTVLCVRRLERRMGIDTLLRAWPAVLAEHPSARLVVVGTGTAESELRSMATALGDTVAFAGHVDDQQLTELYEQAELTVVPTTALEGFGLIALESLAAGRAPIVTDCGGLPDSVRGLDASLIVPKSDADTLGARLAAALHGKLPTPEQCRAHAETFSWDVTAERHLAMYRAISS